MAIKVWLVGGGTAGHVLPLLSLAEELNNVSTKSPSILFVTDRSTTAESLVGEGVQLKRIYSGKLRRYKGRSRFSALIDIRSWLLNIRDLFLVMLGVFQAMATMLKQKPDVVFINGGAIGVPVAFVARIRSVPFVVHESDSVLGLANKIIAKKASVLATTMDVDFGPELRHKTVRVGIPLAKEFSVDPGPESLEHLKRGMNLDGSLPIVLATGGSLGARRLNDWLLGQADELLDVCQLILITGRANYQEVMQRVNTSPPALVSRLHILEYTDRMADLMRLADLVVSRAGATTLMELAALSQPSLVVPNDMLSGGHQTKNAQLLASAGMVETLSESNIQTEPALLIRSIHALLSDETRLRRLSEAINRIYIEDSASRLAKIISELGEGTDD